VPPPGNAAPIPERPLPVPSAPAVARQPEKQPNPFGQPNKDNKFPKGKDPQEYTVLPPRDRIFVIYDDAELERIIMDRIRKDNPMLVKRDLQFPPSPPVGGGQPYRPKTLAYTPMQVNYDAIYVVHRRLHFEELNSERYGWDLGIVQPFVSAMTFYKDVLMWPNSLGSGCAYGFWDTNAGKCLPGSPTPYMLYPPGLTITGSALEGVIITGAAFAF
jgi:hypothetical protein